MHRLFISALCAALAGCYQPIVVARENDPGAYTKHPRGVPAAPKLRVVLQERSDMTLALDSIDTDSFDNIILKVTVNNLTSDTIGYFEVHCRQFDASGQQIEEGSTNEIGLDPKAAQQLSSLYLRRVTAAVVAKCRIVEGLL